MSARVSARRTVRVDLAGRAYDIVIGAQLIDRVGELAAPLLAAPRVIVVSDETVASLYGARLMASFERPRVGLKLCPMPAAAISGVTPSAFSRFTSA